MDEGKYLRNRRKSGRVVDEVPPSRRRDRYPWDTIFDGLQRRFEQGVHFHCLSTSFRTLVYRSARVRGLRVKVSIRGDFDQFVFVKRLLGPRKNREKYEE